MYLTTTTAARHAAPHRLPFRLAYWAAWFRIRMTIRQLSAVFDPARRADLIARISTAYEVMARLHPWARPAWPPYSAADLAGCAALAGRAAGAELGVCITGRVVGSQEAATWSQLAQADNHRDRRDLLLELATRVQQRYSIAAAAVLRNLADTEWALHLKGTTWQT
jgi:hypothetical protein